MIDGAGEGQDSQPETFYFTVGPLRYCLGTRFPEISEGRGRSLWITFGPVNIAPSGEGREWIHSHRIDHIFRYGYGLGKDSRYIFKTLATVVSVVRRQVDRHHPDDLVFRFPDRSHDRFWEKFLRYVVPGFVVEDDLRIEENGVWTVSLDGYYRNSA